MPKVYLLENQNLPTFQNQVLPSLPSVTQHKWPWHNQPIKCDSFSLSPWVMYSPYVCAKPKPSSRPVRFLPSSFRGSPPINLFSEILCMVWLCGIPWSSAVFLFLKQTNKQKHWCQDLVEYPSACAPLSGTKLHWYSLSYLQSTCTDPTLDSPDHWAPHPTAAIGKFSIWLVQTLSWIQGSNHWVSHTSLVFLEAEVLPTTIFKATIGLLHHPHLWLFPLGEASILGLGFCLLALLESPRTRYPVSSVF